MRWIADTSGRFRRRPWYRSDEIDALCEGRVRRFLRERYGAITYPLATDDLTPFIEQEVDDLDLYADLSCFNDGDSVVEGVTTFAPTRRPRVRIARELSDDRRRAARLRTTLAHELGHVLLHGFASLEETRDDWPPTDPDETDTEQSACTPWPLAALSRVDWMEWQAGYASGALLMPRTALHGLIHALHQREGGNGAHVTTGMMVDQAQAAFLVSAPAAYIRLRQLGYLLRPYTDGEVKTT